MKESRLSRVEKYCMRRDVIDRTVENTVRTADRWKRSFIRERLVGEQSELHDLMCRFLPHCIVNPRAQGSIVNNVNNATSNYKRIDTRMSI